jgi:K+-sensing histidine kinase KdpD
MGDESKVASPHSRSVPRFDLFAVGIEALRSEYEASLSEDVVAAMSRLAGRFRQVHAANLAREERRRRGMFAYALHLACHPPALAQVARQRAAYARRMAGGKLSAVREALAARPARATGGSAGALARLRATGVEFATAFVFAVPLVALATIVRGLLSAQLASRSPYMIYVTAAVAGALLRGSLCGALTAAGGALAGLYFFVEPSWSLSARPEDLAALAMFCFVCASVLFPTAMLRRKTSEQETRSVGGGLSQTGMTRQLDL